MHATALSLMARTLYAELREQALAMGTGANPGELPGSLVRKSLRGADYLYYQYRDLSGCTRQAYLGPDDATTQALAVRLAARMSDQDTDRKHLNELRAAFVGAGGAVMEHAPLRVLQGFADAGILQPGPGHAVLVGTHAFYVLGNQLGVRWASHMQTHDIDLAGERDINFAIPHPVMPMTDVLTRLEMGFIPVPALDSRQPSTSFRVRGQSLRVDFLVPQKGKPVNEPVFVSALNAMAQPLRFLDYVLVSPIPVVVVGRKYLCLLNVPSPERFALHKLLVSESRVAAFASKAEKDRLQAMQMLEVLIEQAPDGLPEALADLLIRGKGWSEKYRRALQKGKREYPAVVHFLEGLEST